MFGKGLSSNDIQALTQFNNQIKNGISYSQAYKNSLSNCSVAGKQMAVQIAKGKVSVDSLTSASKASAIGMGLLNAAMNFGIMMAVTGLIELGKYLWKLVPTTEHLKEQLEETAQALADIRSERENLNNELKTTEERIAELEAKGALSFTDEAELNRLRQENAELERKLILLDEEEKKEKEKYRKKFNNLVGKNRELSEGGHYASMYEQPHTYSMSGISDVEYLKELGRAYHDAQMSADGYFAYFGTGTKISAESIKKQIDNMLDDITDYQKYLSDLYENGFNYSTADEETKKNVDFVNEMIDTYMVVVGQTDALWSQVYNRDKFAEARKVMEDLAAAENLTAESLQNWYNKGGNVKEFIDYMLSLNTVDWETMLGDKFTDVAGEDGIVSLDEALKAMSGDTELASKIMGLFANELKKVEVGATFGSNALQTFSSIFDSVQKGTDVLMDAYNDLSDGGEISLEHLMALLDEYPDLVNYIDSENGSHRITIDTLKEKFEAQKEVALQKIETTRKAIELEGAEKSAIEDTLEAMKEKQKQDMAAAMVANGTFKTIDAAIDAINARPGYYLRGLNTSYGHEQAAEKAKNEQLEILDKQAALIKGMTWSDFSGDEDPGSKTIKSVEDQIENLKHQHEMGLISEATYYKKLEAIRKKYYAGKKDYLDRDRELQEEYHNWEVKNAEDNYEKQAKALQKQYINGKITYTELKSKLKKLINDTFKNDKDAKKEHLDELPDYLDESREEKREKNREKFDSSYDKLKYQLENGFISEATYYKKLDALYKKHYSNKNAYLEEYSQYSQEVYDGFKDMYKEDLDAQKEALEEQKEAVTEYYDDLIEKKQEEHDEEDYEKEQSEKRKEIFDLDMQIAELMRDGSEKAKARIAELEEERLQAEKDLLDFETNKAREDEIERLEKEKEQREKEVQDKIDNIDKTLEDLDSNTKDIRDAVIQYAKAKGVDIKFAYASGTRSSVGGFGRINEKGIEMISAPDGNGNYIPMLPSSYVFSAKATEFLWKLATEHSLPQAMYNSIAKSIKTQSSTPAVNIAQPITITMGDVIIKGNADKQTVADIKKQQENTVRMVLQKIKELQK